MKLNRILFPLLLALPVLLGGCTAEELTNPVTVLPESLTETVAETAEIPPETTPEEAAEPTEPEEPEEWTISVYVDAQNREYITRLTESFREYYPYIDVTFADYSALTLSEVGESLAADLRGNADHAPDVILQYQNHNAFTGLNMTALLEDGELLPLDTLDLSLDDCNATVLGAGVYRGTQYFLPLHYSAGCLMTFDDALTDLGILETENLTIREFSEKVKAYYGEHPGAYVFRRILFGSTFVSRDPFPFVDWESMTLRADDETFRRLDEYAAVCRDFFPEFPENRYIAGENPSVFANIIGNGYLTDVLPMFNRAYSEYGGEAVLLPLPTSDGQLDARGQRGHEEPARGRVLPRNRTGCSYAV